MTCSRQQRHDLGRCDGSEDLKPMDHDMMDVIDPLQEYSCGGGDPLHKHYIVPDYGVPVPGKDYVIGATADVIRAGYDVTEYPPTETRDRIQREQQLQQQQQQQQAVSAAMQRGTTPHIHYHVYESPQMT